MGRADQMGRFDVRGIDGQGTVVKWEVPRRGSRVSGFIQGWEVADHSTTRKMTLIGS